MICFNILACSKSGSRFALAWVGTRFRRLGSLDRKSRSRVCRSSFFPDGSNMKENLTSQGFLLFCKNLINLSFLFFVVCNTWSFRHNLNQNKSINKFLRLHSLLFFTFYIFPFCLEINTSYWPFSDLLRSDEQRLTAAKTTSKMDTLLIVWRNVIVLCLHSSSPGFAGLIYSRWLESVMKAICVTDQTPDWVVCAILCHSWK